ncbi:hypothetical protein L1887_16967 [Cichorium endivia]|nr:hypothetical protein L1887_16967 [Cichorium endivia]
MDAVDPLPFSIDRTVLSPTLAQPGGDDCLLNFEFSDLFRDLQQQTAVCRPWRFRLADHRRLVLHIFYTENCGLVVVLACLPQERWLICFSTITGFAKRTLT